MPYIKQEDRTKAKTKPTTAGELNFAITNLVLTYMSKGDLNYQMINDIVGALEGAKLEFYQKIAVGYEAEKERTNGDVYETDASSTNLAWAGGFFEGEGCFYAGYGKARLDGSKVFRTRASLTQKNEKLLIQFKNVVKCGAVRATGKNGMFVWKTDKKGEATKVFNLLRPYLGERRQKTYLELFERENNQIFRPKKKASDICRQGHDKNIVGRLPNNSCKLCDSNSKKKHYNNKTTNHNINKS